MTQTEFENVIKSLYGISTETMHDYQVEIKLIEKTPNNLKANNTKNVTISGKVIENSIEITTMATREHIKDFQQYEIKSIKMIPGPNSHISDICGNNLKCITNNVETKLRANGDVRIMPFSTIQIFHTKVENILMPLYYNQYDKTSKFGKIMNFATFHIEDAKFILVEYQKIINGIINIDLTSEKECKAFQNKIKTDNKIVKIKKQKKQNKDEYYFEIMFNFNEFMKYCKLLFDNDTIKNIDIIFKSTQEEKEYYANLCSDYIKTDRYKNRKKGLYKTVDTNDIENLPFDELKKALSI